MFSETPIPRATAATTSEYTLRQLVSYALKLGSLGFGGPVALVGYMHRDLVERRNWISDADYKDGLALAQMAPGPLAAQLAIYLGYVRFRVLGATLGLARADAGASRDLLARASPRLARFSRVICSPSFQRRTSINTAAAPIFTRSSTA